jgi:hypothetical protein
VKKDKRHIIYSWIVMICFIAGQWAVYAHYHRSYRTTAAISHHTTVSENCQLCDAMHHNSMTIDTQPYFAHLTITKHYFTPVHYNFVSISLILAAGRAPPVS